MNWRIAESLEILRRQLNAAFPKRSKASDGGIGDAAHASRSSDHNPWFKDRGGIGIVSARDFTHDPVNGMDCHKLAANLIRSRDPRIKYIIWNGQICSSKTSPWQWRKYTGKNAHKHHLHISVNSDSHLFDDPRPWDLGLIKKTEVTPENVGEKIDEISAATNTPPSPSGEAEKVGSTEQTSSAETQMANQASSPEQATEQTNIDAPTGQTTVVEQKNEQTITEKVEEAPAKDGSTAQATKLTIAGFVVPTFIAGLIKAIQDLISQGFINAADFGAFVLQFVRENTRYVLYLVGLIILILIVKKIFKQLTFLVGMIINANPRWHDVKIVPAEKEIK